MQNSGVSVDGHSNHFCSVSDNNPVQAFMPYYGVIEEIWELDYYEFRVVVFKCLWVNGNTRVRKDKMGFTLVDLENVVLHFNFFMSPLYQGILILPI